MAIKQKTSPPPIPSQQDEQAVRTAQMESRLPRINPEIDNKINLHMERNPKFVEYLNNLDKTVLVRKLVYEDVKAYEAKQNLNRGFKQLAESNPALTQAVAQIRASQPADKIDMAIASLGRSYAQATGQRVAPIKEEQTAPAQVQRGPSMSV